MQPSSSASEEKLKAVFTEFQSDPVVRLKVAVRQKRAAQLRELLADPDVITVDIFNSEVWPIERLTLLRSQNRRINVLGTQFTDEDIATLQRALDADDLELHGNYVWGSASRVYGPMLKSTSDKLMYLQRLVCILNDHTAIPLQKAQHIIAQVAGCGPNTATGLVMIFHPREFAIYNTVSKESLGMLGYKVGTLEVFEDAIATLRAHLKAQDFIELDLFLYYFNTGKFDVGLEEKYWWVNQGRSFHEESTGGFLWAPQRDSGGRRLAYHAAVGQLRPGDRLLHYSGQAIQAIGRVHKQPEVTSRPGEPSSPAGYLAEVEYEGLPQPVPLAGIPIELRKAEARRTSNGPFDERGNVKMGYLFPVSVAFGEAVRPQHPLGPEPPVDTLTEPPLDPILNSILEQGLRISEDVVRRYYLALKTRGFVILSGLSGTGKTWLTDAYARAIGAEYLLVPVAPNWTTNEDLLGYFNPLDGTYHDTPFSRFLRRAAREYERAQAEGRTPVPYHLVLDEMNLARVEYYFAKFLSAMETRARNGKAAIELGPAEYVTLPPSLAFIGTVNVDETTHAFADKVYDRAQLIELEAPRDLLQDHMGDAEYRDLVMQVWDAVHDVAPFAFRILDEIAVYVREADKLDVGWQDAVDEQLVQKVLPKLKGADLRVETALRRFIDIAADRLPLSHAKAVAMHEGFIQHGFASYF